MSRWTCRVWRNPLGGSGSRSVDREPLGNVLELWACPTRRPCPGRVSSRHLIDHLRDADGVRLGQCLEPRGDVHPIAKHIAILLDDVAQVDANADVNLFRALFLGVVGAELGLNLLGALHGVHDGRKVHQEGIADGFDDRAVMRGHRLLNDLVMDGQQPQRTGFVCCPSGG